MIKKNIPLRRCNGCGEMKPKKELIRVILTPEGAIELDVTGKKNGRGAYICRNSACFDAARKTKAISRSLHVDVPEEVYDRLRKEIGDEQQ
ncbi:MAG: YlxR family protein [Lachnospiraceae bacterium]|nr:YlxR family protein [Lachnospiraceae bacterium]